MSVNKFMDSCVCVCARVFVCASVCARVAFFDKGMSLRGIGGEKLSSIHRVGDISKGIALGSHMGLFFGVFSFFFAGCVVGG